MMIEVVLAVVAICLWFEFSVLVLLPVYRAISFLARGLARRWREAWVAGKLRYLQPQTREELLSGLANQKRVNLSLAPRR